MAYSEELRQQQIKDGAAMRAMGGSDLKNPWLEKVPKNTGLSFEDHNSLWEAWQFGWNMENAVMAKGL